MATGRFTRRAWGGAAVLLLGVGGLLAAGAAAPEQPAKKVAFDPLAVDSAVVQVHVRRHTSPTSAVAQTGTGVVLPGGRIVTAKHLFKDSWNDVEIVFGGRTGHPEQKVTWTGDPVHVETRDVTVIPGVKIPDWVKPAKLATRPALVGDSLVSFGLSRPGRPRLRGGVVDSVEPSGMIVIDVNSSEGDSGGPTFNQNNEVVGIHNGVETRTWEGSWGKRADVFSVSVRVTDLPQVTKTDKPEKPEKKP